MNLLLPRLKRLHSRNLLFALLFFHSLQAQTESPKLKTGYVKGGISLLLAGASTSNDLTIIPAITVAPGWRMVNSKDFSIALESPISLGVSLNEDKASFGFDLPATLNFNFGLGSSSQSRSKFGWSIGAGKAYHYSYNEYQFDSDDDYNDELSLWGTILQTSLFFSKGCIRFHMISNFSNQPVRKGVVGIGIMALID